MNIGNLHINQFTIKALELNSGDKCLEVGMGNGYFIESIFRQYGDSIQYFGLDHSSDMIREATGLNKEKIINGNVVLKEGRIEDMPFSKKHFDVVFSINTMYFWSDVPLTLQKIKDVLKPAGKLLLANRPKALMQNYPMVKHGFRLFEEAEIRSSLHKAGFEKIRLKNIEEPAQEVYGQNFPKSTLLITAVKPDGLISD